MVSAGNPYSRRQNAEDLEEIARGTLSSSPRDGDVSRESEAQLKAIPFKICLIGNSDVGKTCIVERYVNNTFAIQANTLSAAFSTINLVVRPPGCH